MTCRPRIIKTVLFSIAVLMLAVTVAAALGALLGDADCDSEVTILDATTIQRHLAALPTSEYNEEAADTDGDGEVSILDATYIQRWLAGLGTPYPIGELIEEPTERPTQPPTQNPTQKPSQNPAQPATDAEGWSVDIYRP